MDATFELRGLEEGMDREIVAGNGRVKITWGFVVHLAIMLCSMCGLYYGMKAEIDQQIMVNRENQARIIQLETSMQRLEMDNARQTENLLRFRETYEKDMDRWIREPKR